MATENEVITAALNELEADVQDKQLLSERLKLFIAALDAPVRVETDDEDGCTEPTLQPKRKRGRPLGSKNKPKAVPTIPASSVVTLNVDAKEVLKYLEGQLITEPK